MSQFVHDDDTKAIAIPPFFSKNSRAKKGEKGNMLVLVITIFSFSYNAAYSISDKILPIQPSFICHV